MKIKTKLSFEIILLVSLIGMVSMMAILNTKQVQDAFLDLSTETMPILDTLKDMKLATSLITSTTMKIMLIEDEIQNSNGKWVKDLEEQIEFELFEMENAKALFTEAYTRHSIVMDNIPDSKQYGDTIVDGWNDFISTSNKMVTLKNRGASTSEIIQLKDEFELQEEHVLSSSYLLDYNIKPRDILDLISKKEIISFCTAREIKTRGDEILNILDWLDL